MLLVLDLLSRFDEYEVHCIFDIGRPRYTWMRCGDTLSMESWEEKSEDNDFMYTNITYSIAILEACTASPSSQHVP